MPACWVATYLVLSRPRDIPSSVDALLQSRFLSKTTLTSEENSLGVGPADLQSDKLGGSLFLFVENEEGGQQEDCTDPGA